MAEKIELTEELEKLGDLGELIKNLLDIKKDDYYIIVTVTTDEDEKVLEEKARKLKEEKKKIEIQARKEILTEEFVTIKNEIDTLKEEYTDLCNNNSGATNQYKNEEEKFLLAKRVETLTKYRNELVERFKSLEE